MAMRDVCVCVCLCVCACVCGVRVCVYDEGKVLGGVWRYPLLAPELVSPKAC